jgi:hypothetical protein
MGDEITFGCYIVNHIGIDYASFIKLYYSVDGDTVDTPLIFYTFLPIINGDSIGFFVDSMIVGGPTWHLGSDVVVVWPVTSYGDGPALTYNVEVQDSTLGNAAEDFISEAGFYFDTQEKILHLERVEEFETLMIFSADGKLQFTSPVSQTIDVHALQKGIYIVRMTDKQGRIFAGKICLN